MAESSAERRLSKEPRIETTASVTCWLFCSDSRSSAARCARLSIFPRAPKRRRRHLPLRLLVSVVPLVQNPDAQMAQVGRGGSGEGGREELFAGLVEQRQ
uniref:Uncharacterized protein n=1 Tax=Arundo donax TaxID=35708 RepID=A0A0A9EDE5_ARUDO